MMDRDKLKEIIAEAAVFSNEQRAFLMLAIDSIPPDLEFEIHAPRNYMGRIEQIWAYLSIDDGGEGVCAAPVEGIGTLPLIAADRIRLEQLRPFAVTVAKVSKRPVRLACFRAREDKEIIQP